MEKLLKMILFFVYRMMRLEKNDGVITVSEGRYVLRLTNKFIEGLKNRKTFDFDAVFADFKALSVESFDDGRFVRPPVDHLTKLQKALDDVIRFESLADVSLSEAGLLDVERDFVYGELINSLKKLQEYFMVCNIERPEMGLEKIVVDF